MKKNRIVVVAIFISVILGNIQLIGKDDNYSKYKVIQYPSKKEESREVLLLAGGIVILSTIGYLLSTWAGNTIYNNAKRKYDTLAEFQNTEEHYTDEYRYEQLKNKARDMYFDQASPSSTSIDNDYPVVWLEKKATAIKNFLSLMIFSKRMKELSKQMEETLSYLRNFDQFIQEKIEYNEKYRKQAYRDDRLNLEREKISIEREKLDHKQASTKP